MEYFKRVAPESVGISSAGILDFLEEVQKKGIEMHSLMVIRHGKCCSAGWWEPYGPEDLNPLFSFSKTLTATAIGFAWQEGLLSLEERLIDIFPEEAPAAPSLHLQKVTLEHLLIMGCGHDAEPVQCMEDPDWIRAFLHHPVVHEPGTFYIYNTAGTNMLAAVILRKTGQNVTEYLRPRLFDPLGIGEVACRRMPGREGVEAGGFGMKLTTEDMARFTWFLKNRGCWEENQLLREEWFDRACSKRIETAGDKEGHVREWAQGYGYQCWMGSIPGSFRVDGAYGQFGFVFPALDMVVIATMATEQTQSMIDSLLARLLPAVGEDVLPVSREAGILQSRLERASVPVLSGSRSAWLEEKMAGVIYRAETTEPGAGCDGLERLIGGVGLATAEESVLEEMWFSIKERSLVWHVREKGEEICLEAALDGRFFKNSVLGHRYGACARFRGPHALELEIRRTDAISGVSLLFRFLGERLLLEADDTLVAAGIMGRSERKTCAFYRKR